MAPPSELPGRPPDQLSSDLASLRIDASSRTEQARGGGVAAKLGWLVAALALAAGGVVAGPRLLALANQHTLEVDVAMVQAPSSGHASTGGELTATGYVVPEQLVRLAPRSGGRIEKVLVREGDVVKAGQVLFVFDSASRRGALHAAQARASSARARALTARASLAELEQRLERDRKLAASGAVAQAAVDDQVARQRILAAQVQSAEADAAAAHAEVTSLQTDLGDTSVVSPIDGKAISKPMALGDMASSTTTLVEIASIDSLAVEIDVPEARLDKVKPQSKAEITLDAFPSRKLRGVVMELRPKINRAKATGTVRVKLLDGLDVALPDMAARASIQLDALPSEGAPPAASTAATVPATAVVTGANGTGVFVVEQGKVRLVPVKVGATTPLGVELLEGPPAGAKVVATPTSSLSDGQAVKERGES